MVVEEIHVEDIFELVSLVYWTFRIVAHEEDQYTDFPSIALKQTKAGPPNFFFSFIFVSLCF